MPHKPYRTRKAQRDNRPSASRRGYDQAWKAARAAFLLAHPLCQAMLRDGRACGRPARHVDHRKALNAGGDKYDHANLQALCHSCHSRKTVYCDGGLGRGKGR